MIALRPLCVASLIALSAPTVAHPACIGPDGATVYGEPRADGPVWGGIAGDQCGFRPAANCIDGYCFGFFQGLSGFVPQAELRGADDAPQVMSFLYRFVRANGDLTAMGETAPFAIDADTPLEVLPSPYEAIVRMPPPWSTDILLEKTGGSTWDGTVPDWMGLPVPVVFEMDQLGADRARLRLFADHPTLQMDVLLHLDLIAEDTEPDAPQDSAGLCDLVDEKASAILASGDPVMARPLVDAVSSLGLTDWASKTEGDCARLAAALAPVAMEETATPPDVTCENLAADLRPILWDTAHPLHREAVTAMQTVGLNTFAGADVSQCQSLAALLSPTGVLRP